MIDFFISKPANLKLNSVSNSWEKIWLKLYNSVFEDSNLHLLEMPSGNLEFLKLDPNGNPKRYKFFDTCNGHY